jgi:DNA-binding NtrC family response regulator
MNKIHILLVENRENEIEFFIEALKESGLSFFCNTARNVDDAFKILKNATPDAVFVDAYMIKPETLDTLKKIKSAGNVPVILYSTVRNKPHKVGLETLSYVQLPGNIQTMAHILKNLFIDNEIHNQPATFA